MTTLGDTIMRTVEVEVALEGHRGRIDLVAERLPGPLNTKLVMPRQGYVLPRPRLSAVAGRLRRGGVVTVIAGPGYGKTAYLGDILASSAGPSAFYALDESDRDPAQFLDYLIQACAGAHPGIGDAARVRLDECLDVRRETLHVVAALLSEMAAYAGSRTTLAFDDVHTVEESEAVVSALSFLVDGLPPGWTAVFASRRRLPFPVADLRRRDRLVEVDVRRLRLTPSEVEEWARGSWGVDLSLADARTLWRLTEGWPVALVLLGERLRQGGRLGLRDEVFGLSRQGRHLNEYLADAVFRSLDEETAAVLESGSLAPRLVFPRDAPLFPDAAVAEGVLEDLVARGFLVGQTGHRTYTMHPLLRQFVTREGRRADPARAAALAGRVACHLEQVGELREAVNLYLRSGRVKEAVRPLRSLAATHLNTASVYACEEWLDLLPADVVAGEPWLLVLRARVLQGRGEYRQAEPLYRAAAQLFEEPDDRGGLFQTLVGRAFCLYMTGRWDDSLASLGRAEQVAASADERAEVQQNTANVLLSRCRWDEAVERYEAALALARGPSRRALEVRVFASRARLFFLRGRYVTALDWSRRAVELASGEPRLGYATSLNAAATLLYLTGRYEEAAIQAEAALALVRARGYVFLEAPVLLSLAGVALGTKDMHSALSHVKKAQALSLASGDVESELWAEDMLGDICRRNRSPEKALKHHRYVLEVAEREQLSMFESVRALCGVGMDLAVLGTQSEARAALEQTVDLSRRWGFDGPLSQGLFYLGWIYASAGAEQSASRALHEATRIAAGQRHMHFLVQEATVAVPILALAARIGAGGAFMDEVISRLNGRLQSHFESLARGETYPTDVPLGAPRRSRLQGSTRSSGGDPTEDAGVLLRVSSLTPRELEILRMIAAGMPNKVIATKLFITEKTVKTHANRVYRKLDVTNRLQAVLALQEYDRAFLSAPPRPRPRR